MREVVESSCPGGYIITGLKSGQVKQQIMVNVSNQSLALRVV